MSYLRVRRDLALRPTGRSRRRREAPLGRRGLEQSDGSKRRSVLQIAGRSSEVVRYAGYPTSHYPAWNGRRKPGEKLVIDRFAL